MNVNVSIHLVLYTRYIHCSYGIQMMTLQKSLLFPAESTLKKAVFPDRPSQDGLLLASIRCLITHLSCALPPVVEPFVVEVANLALVPRFKNIDVHASAVWYP